MKFLVSGSQERRHAEIRSFLTQDTAIIAALLAAVDFEWTVRRVLDHLSLGDPGASKEHHVSGLDGYARAWTRVFKGVNAKNLQDVVGNWEALKEAYQLRHDIVHGKQGSSGVAYVTTRVSCILAASEAVATYGRELGADPYKRLRKRGALTSPAMKKKKC
jgi:hypothetical protein